MRRSPCANCSTTRAPARPPTSPPPGRWRNRRRVLARTLDDGAGEAEALYRLASIAYSVGPAGRRLRHRARCSRAGPQGGRHRRRGVGAQPGRPGALQRRQLLRGARVGAAGARAVPPDRPPGRRGQPAEHDRDHPPLAGRHRSGTGHLRGRAHGQQGPRTSRQRRADPVEHGRGACRTQREPAGSQPRRGSARAQSRARARVRRPRSSPGSPSRTARSQAVDRATACLDEADACWPSADDAPAAISRAPTPRAARRRSRWRWREARSPARAASPSWRSSTTWQRLAVAQATATWSRTSCGRTPSWPRPTSGSAGSRTRCAHQEARFTQHEALFSQGTDLRIKTLQIAHDTEAARQQAEILRLRTGELEALVRGRTYDLEEYQLEAFQRLAVLAEFRDTDTGEHTIRVGDLSAEIAAELGEPDRVGRPAAPGRSPARHRQGRGARLDPAEAGPADDRQSST